MSIKSSLAIAVLALLPFAATPADAQDAKTPRFRFGIGASLINPIGELGDYGKQGFGASLAIQFTLYRKMAIQARLEYFAFGQRAEEWNLQFRYSPTYKVSTTSTNGMMGMMDLVYSFGSLNRGLYIFCGGGFISSEIAYTGEWDSELGQNSGPAPKNTAPKTTALHIGWSGGSGYNFTKNIGVEVSITYAPDDTTFRHTSNVPVYTHINNNNKIEPSPDPDFSYVQASLRWRF